jgi:hypothetical protein
MTEAATAFDELEAIAEQSSFGINKGTRTRYHVGWQISPSIERASAAREGKAIEKTPAARLDEDEKSTLNTIEGGPDRIIISEPVTCYRELIEGLRSRVGTLGVRYLDFDKLAGFADGLSGKVFGPAEVKRLGIEKMFDAIRAAGLRLRLEEDPEQTARMQARIAENFNPRQA